MTCVCQNIPLIAVPVSAAALADVEAAPSPERKVGKVGTAIAGYEERSQPSSPIERVGPSRIGSVLHFHSTKPVPNPSVGYSTRGVSR